MVNRFWDPKGRYPHGLLREYGHWVLEVSYRQHTLGCYIIFSKHNIDDFSGIPDEAAVELIRVQRDIERALKVNNKFNPSRFNYLQLGNRLSHLHIHGIPRYSFPRDFADRKWVDSTYGLPPVWTFEDSSHFLVTKIKYELYKSLEEIVFDGAVFK